MLEAGKKKKKVQEEMPLRFVLFVFSSCGHFVQQAEPFV